MGKLQPGDVVQLDPYTTENPMFRGCMLTVTEVKEWGIQGYVQSLGQRNRPGGQAYYRAKTGTYEHVGQAQWVQP
jgi:hypothetical protein